MLPSNFKRAATKEDQSEAKEEEKQHFDSDKDNDRAIGDSVPTPTVPWGRPSRNSAPLAVDAGLTEKTEKLNVDGNGA